MQLFDQHWDIIIVGGGLAGSAMGLALRDYPGQVAVVDAAARAFPSARDKDNHFDQRNISLADSSRRVFNSLGIWKDVTDAATAIKTIHVSQQHAFGVSRIHAAEESLEALAWVVPYPLLLNALQAGLDNSNTKFFPQTKVQSLTDTGDGVYLQIRANTGLRRTKSRLVILAEGGGRLLKSAGFRTRTLDYRHSAIVTNVRTERYIEHTAYERFTRHGILAVLPLNKQRYGIIQAYPDNVLKRMAAQALDWNEAYFAMRLRKDFGNKLGNVTQVGKRVLYPLRLSQTTKLVHCAIVALGNAAHTLHPVVGQSFNLTLRDVAFLAQELLAEPENPANERLLENWQRRRRWDIWQVAAFTDFMARATALPLAPLFSGKVLLAFDMFPSLQRALIKRGLGLEPPASRLASGLPLVYH